MFQFTHPGRGATVLYPVGGVLYGVSIHAPREGCDLSYLNTNASAQEFQFTHPGRGATAISAFCHYGRMFQFTHPGRGATKKVADKTKKKVVSIHAPREGCDSLSCLSPLLLTTSFNSRTPGGVRHRAVRRLELSQERFNSRTPGGVRLDRSFRSRQN